MRTLLFILIVLALFAPWIKPAKAEGEAVVAVAVVAGIAMTYAAANEVINGPDDDDE